MIAPVLVFGYGNPSRGDDALGPEFVREVELRFAAQIARGELEVLTDFQLQVEHVLDLKGRERVYFVDAAESDEPFAVRRLEAGRDASFTSHLLSPQALLHTFREVERSEPPECFVVAIGGERFELGEELSVRARANLTLALADFATRGTGPVEPRQAGRRLTLRGQVQGVGLRPFVLLLATELGLTGSVRNGPEGVTVDAFGAPAALDRLVARLAAELPAPARVDQLEARPLLDEPARAFSILSSDLAGARLPSLPPDLATCEDCRAELFDPAARRFGHPFTNCTHCGPRFSIATALPYDRERTTMAGFPLCAACRSEYEEPQDRRFHAEPIACPACGPSLSFLDAAGKPVEGASPLEHAAGLLAQGGIVAVRGLGGFHLACDATDEGAVRELRRRKVRDAKPLAVLVRGLDDARSLARLSPEEELLLTSPARPIVLVEALRPNGLAPSVAPGSTRVGLFLSYTPLHELLLASLARPLVMTSGNLCDEPMALEIDDALERLGGIADGFLVHDRPIASRVDDSVARIVAGAPMLLRRARGFVPEALVSPVPFPEPVLAVGGQQKSCCCVGAGSSLTLGAHVGDLDELLTLESFSKSTERLQQLLAVAPAVLAHDLHPDYASTRFALERPALQRIGVQHHHAHVAAVMAEHGLLGPVLGVAYDGTGFGPDGTAWGGELLLATLGGYRRLGTLRALPLAGGERAIREPWRVTLAALDDAFDGTPPLDRLGLFAALPERSVENVRQLLRTGLVTRAHGVGRLFDAAAALLLCRPTAAYEAQLAVALEEAAVGPVLPWPFELTPGEPLELDLRPMWRGLVAELLQGLPVPLLAARFHATLAAGTAALVRTLLEREGPLPIVLAGGCFANARLVDELLCRLDGLVVQLPRRVPPGDGGLALGQAVVAAATLTGALQGAP